MSITEPQAATTTAERLHALAEWLDAHPAATGITISLHSESGRVLDGRPTTAEDMTRLAREIGGHWRKETDDTWFFLLQEIAPGITYEIYTGREAVCERVVVDHQEVEVEEPDPDAVAALPKVKRIETREIVEWRCPDSLLDAR